MKKLVYVLVVLFAFCAFGHAQQNVKVDIVKDSTVFYVSSPFANIYLSGGLGIQTLIGNEPVASARYNPITPDFYVEVGKWFTPDFAISVNVNGLNLKGQSRYANHPYIDFSDVDELPDADGNYSEYKSFNMYYVSLMAQATFDWVNMIYGYPRGKSMRNHVYTSFGMGFAWENSKKVTMNKDNISALCGSVSVALSTRLTERLSLIETLKMMILRGSFDHSPFAGAKNTIADFVPSLTVGVKYALTKEKYKEKVANLPDQAVVYEEPEDSMDSTEYEEDDMLRELQELDDNPMAQIILSIFEEDLLYSATYYQINRYNIDEMQKNNLKVFAKTIKEDGGKFYVIGAADSATGTEEINFKLSIRRARTVRDYLINECKVDPDKLHLVALGGILSSKTLELNRFCIVVQDYEEIEEIVRESEKHE